MDRAGHTFLGFEPASASWLALTMIELGKLDEAETVLAQSVDRGHFHHVRTSATYYLHEARARLALAKGEAAKAAALATEALTHCRSCGEAMHELHALMLCREVEAATGTTIAQASDVPLDALAERIRALGIAPLEQRLAAIGKRV